jgi:hypothetical protein
MNDTTREFAAAAELLVNAMAINAGLQAMQSENYERELLNQPHAYDCDTISEEQDLLRDIAADLRTIKNRRVA